MGVKEYSVSCVCPNLVPSVKCGQMWTKIFCPQKSGKNQGFKGRKNAPDLDDQEHFNALWGKNLTSGFPQQQQQR